MRRGPWFRRLAALMSVLPVAWLAPPALSPAFGQDEPLEFGEDEGVIESDQPEGTGESQFGEEDVIDSTNFGPPVTTGLVIPSSNLDEATAETISDLLVDELHNIPDVQAVDYLNLRDEFDVMGSELALDCAFDPVCLGRVAADAGLDEVIIGRATGRNGSELQLVLDRVSVETRSVIRYRPVTTDSDVRSLTQMVHATLGYLYDIRPETDGHAGGPRGKSDVQIALAWTALGLGVVALGTGIYFGISANSAEGDVTGARIVDGTDGVLDLTQVDATRQLNDAQDDALLANIMFGTGLALIGVSVLLFLITPGGDIDTEAEQGTGALDRMPRVGAVVTEDGWGVFSQIRF